MFPYTLLNDISYMFKGWSILFHHVMTQCDIVWQVRFVAQNLYSSCELLTCFFITMFLKCKNLCLSLWSGSKRQGTARCQYWEAMMINSTINVEGNMNTNHVPNLNWLSYSQSITSSIMNCCLNCTVHLFLFAAAN